MQEKEEILTESKSENFFSWNTIPKLSIFYKL